MSARRAAAELHSGRARTATRTPSRAAIGRRCARIAACSQICNDEAIDGERLEFEDIDAGLFVRDERIGVCVEVGAAHNKIERAQLTNHVATAGARPDEFGLRLGPRSRALGSSNPRRRRARNA
jgi:ferredoxin